MPLTEPRIRDWPKDDRPRDKLREKRARDLSNVELLAVLIGPGNARCNGLELARKVLASVKGRLSELTKQSILDLMRIPGIGKAKASAIYAFAELSRRRQAEEGLEKFQVKETRTAAAFIRPLLGDLDHEEFGVMFLNSANELINFEVVSIGGITATYIDPRIIFKKALEYNATGLIMGHNRVGGPAIPRRQDEILNQRLIDAAKYLDIKLLDYIIVTENGYYSFAAEGKLD
jgi:DNA repair protein RadC